MVLIIGSILVNNSFDIQAQETPITFVLSISNGMQRKAIVIDALQKDSGLPLAIQAQHNGTVVIKDAHKSLSKDIRILDQETQRPLLYVTLGKNVNPVHEAAFEHMVFDKKNHDYFLRMSSCNRELVNSWRFAKSQVQNPDEEIEIELDLELKNEQGKSFSKFFVRGIRSKNLNNFVIDSVKKQKTIIPIKEDYFK